jgi:O-antigen/teichoic acid export membrane protein
MTKLDVHLREVLSKGSVSLLAKVIGVGTNFALQVILGRKLGADGVGLYYLSLAVVTFATLLSRLGIDYNLTRVVAAGVAAGTESTVRTHFWYAIRIGAVSSILMSAVLLSAAPWLAETVFSKADLLVTLRVMAIGVPPLALSILIARALQGLRRTGEAMLIEFSVIPIISCILVYALISRFEVTGAAIAYCAGVYSALLFAIWAWRRQTIGIHSPVQDGACDSMGTFVGNSVPFLGVLVLQQVAQVLPLLILGSLATSAQVGIYYAAHRTAALTGLVLIAVNSILAPKLAALYEARDIRSLDQLIRWSGMLIVGLASPALVLFFLVPDFVMQIFGSEFSGHGNLLRVMAVGQVINVTTGTLGFVLMMTDKARIMLVTTFWMASSNAVLCVLLIPTYGAYGAAIASAGSLLVAGVTRIVFIWRELGILALPLPSNRRSDSGD